MSVVNTIPLIAAGDDGYSLTRSLRFRSSASAYLNRTFGTPTSGTTWTWSGWVKLGTIPSTGTLFEAGTGATNTFMRCTFGQVSAELNWRQVTSVGGLAAEKGTSMLFRDPSAWYHIVCVWDTSNATAADRQRVYVNGVQITSFGASTNPSLNLVSYFNTASYVHYIGALSIGGLGGYLDGYMAEVNFIDGQALAPTAFGTVNSYGVWQPITYGGSYGTNGFRLPFTNNASTTTLGYDFSPQGNNWTTNNISVTAGSTYDSMTDVPTLTSATAANYAVLNAVDIGYSAVLSEANLKVSTASSGNAAASSTMAMTGNTYWEVTIGSNSQIGLIWGPASDAYGNSKLSMFANGATGSLNNATRTLSATPSWSNGDTLGFAWSSSARTLTLYQAGSATAVMTMTTPTTGDPMIAITNYTSGAAMSSFLNCGQRPFTYTPPSGYVALNTFNL